MTERAQNVVMQRFDDDQRASRQDHGPSYRTTALIGAED
jgi:hypothetical protein